MFDPQETDAGVLGIARLQGGNDTAGFIAQRACFIECFVVALAHEAAVALEGGQIGRQCGGQFRGEHAVGLAAGLHRLGDFRRRVLERGKRAGEIGGGEHAVADGGKIARPATPDRKARQGAREIGRRRKPRAGLRPCRDIAGEAFD